MQQNQKTNLKKLLLLTLLIFVFTVSFGQKSLINIKSYDSRAEDNFWFLELYFPAKQVENQLTTIVPALEKSLRSESGIKNLTIITQTNKIIAAFSTDAQTDTKFLANRINFHMSILKESEFLPQFNFLSIHVPFSKTTQFSGSSNNSRYRDKISAFDYLNYLIKTFSVEGSSTPYFSILNQIPVDVEIMANKEIFKTEHEMDLILERLQTIPGIQKVFVKNYQIDILNAELDTRQLLHLGLNVNEVSNSIQTHLQSDSTNTYNILGKNVPLFNKNTQHISDLCKIGIFSTRTANSVQLCDITNLARQSYYLPLYFSNMPLSFFEYFSTYSQMKNSSQETTISLLLEPGFLPADVLPIIKSNIKILFPNKSEKTWIIKADTQENNHLYIILYNFATLVMCAILYLKKHVSLNTSTRNIIFILCSINIWTNFITLANINVDVQSIIILIVTCTIYGICIIFEQHTTSKQGSASTALNYLVFAMLTLFSLIIIDLILNSVSLIAEKWYAYLLAAIIPSLCYYLTAFKQNKLTEASKTPENPPKITTKKSFLTILAIIAPATTLLNVDFSSLNHTLIIEAGLGNKINFDRLREFNINMQNISDKYQLQFQTLSTQNQSIYELSPSNFSLIKQSIFSINNLIDSLKLQVIGKFSITTGDNQTKNMPFLLRPREIINTKTATKEGEFDKIKSWLETMQIPEFYQTTRIKSETIKENYIPLSAFINITKKQNLSQAISTEQGFGSLAKITVPNKLLPTVLEEIEQLSTNLKNKSLNEVSIKKYSSIEKQEKLMLSNSQSTNLLFVIIFFIGALFFKSLSRGLITSLTFGVFNEISLASRNLVSLIFDAQNSASIGDFPSHSLINTMLMLIFWSIMIKTTDYRRTLNMSLEQALAPQFTVIKYLRPWFVGLLGLMIIIVFTINNNEHFQLILTSVLSFYIGLCVLLPSWIVFFTSFNEHLSRLTLKTKIHLTKQLINISLILAIIGYSQTAKSNTALVDSTCTQTATIILPIIGRPKGKEPPPHKAIYSEKLAQETPCSLYDTSLLTPIIDIITANQNNGNQNLLVKDLNQAVTDNYEKFSALINDKIVTNSKNSIKNFRILGGFYEEFFGNIAFTIIEFRKNGEPIVSKMTFPEEKQTIGISEIAGYLRGDSIKFYEEILGESERLPVFLETTESLDKHPVSENLAGEIDLFLKSRFMYPISLTWLERKTFFRYEPIPEHAFYSLAIKIRRDSTKLYASLSAISKKTTTKETAWIEGDISQLPEFEENILAIAKKMLANTEKIADYCITFSGDFLFNLHNNSNLYGITFRQNLGNAALSLRLRSGTHPSPSDELKFSLFGIGGGLGWQFVDFRWLAADLGISMDVGLLTKTNTQGPDFSRSFWVNYGPYLQSQLTLWKDLSIFARGGIEQPQLFGNRQERKLAFSPFYINLITGIGVTF